MSVFQIVFRVVITLGVMVGISAALGTLNSDRFQDYLFMSVGYAVGLWQSHNFLKKWGG